MNFRVATGNSLDQSMDLRGNLGDLTTPLAPFLLGLLLEMLGFALVVDGEGGQHDPPLLLGLGGGGAAVM